MKTIVIAFSLKEQSFELIKINVMAIRNYHEEEVILIHGFMNEKEIKKRGLRDDVGKLFRKYFPVRLNLYNGGVLRDEMAKIASALGAVVYVIGEVKGGVAEEVDLYKRCGLQIINLPL